MIDRLKAAYKVARHGLPTPPAPLQKRMYHAAKSSRLTGGWVTSTTSADAEIRGSLTNLRARSRALCRDSAYAKRARVLVVNNVIGGGMGLQAQVKSSRKKLLARVNDAVEDAWKYWNVGAYCHTGGTLHFSDFERALMSEVFETGEVFIREHRVSFGGCEIPYALEMIESERVPHSIEPPAGNTVGHVRMGVEVDRYYRPVAYWIRDRHPSDIAYSNFDPERIDRVPASEIIHLRIVDRWPQTRGVPWLHAVARKVNDMDGYSEAEIIAARGAANYLAWLEQSDLDDPDVEEQEDGTYQTQLEPGIIGRGPPGSEIKFLTPNRPNTAFDGFMRAMVREMAVGTGMGLSYASMSGDYSQSNYSSSRLSLLDDRDSWRVLQAWFIRAFRDIVHKNWLQQAVLARMVPGIGVDEYAANPTKFQQVKYKPRGWSWVDPTKEVEAYKEALRGGFITRTAVVSQTADGADVEDIDRERREELDAQAELGLTYDTDPGADANKTAPKEKPAPAEGEGGETEEEERVMRIVR
jgi:lambda family phage portal protein